MTTALRIMVIAAVAVVLTVIVLVIAASRSADDSVLTRADSTPVASSSAPPTATRAVPTAVPSPTSIPIVATTTPVPVHTVRLSFSGDVLSHTPVYGQARAYGTDEMPYDYRPMFAEVQDRLTAADLAICVLETPVSSDNSGLAGYPTFNAPRELPAALFAVGFDGCSTASNHSYDRGPTGIESTLTQMDEVGLGHAGMARSEEERDAVTMYTVGEVQVAHLSWTYGLNGFVLPPDMPWLANVTDVDGILSEADRAREAGADVVVLSIQWGNEYVTDPTPNQLELVEALTSPGVIDLIAGNHAHVIQPVDTVNDTPVIYGLGNFLSNQSSACCPARSQDGVIIEVVLSGKTGEDFAVDEIVAVPTWVDRSNYTIVPVIESLNDADVPEGTRGVYETSRDRTMEVLTRLGADIIFE